MVDKEFTSVVHPDYIDKKERLALRLFVFILFYVLVNYFILSEIYYFLAIEKNQFFSFLLIVLSFSYVLGAAAIRYSNNILAIIVNVLGSIWLGTMLFACFSFVLISLFVLLGFVGEEQRILFALLLTCFMVFYSLINALMTTTKRIKITSKKIKEPLTIVQVSDLHIGAAHKEGFLMKIINQIKNQNPDVVVITGDLIDGKHKYTKNYFGSLKELKIPTLMVTGNHERMTGMMEVNKLLKNSGMKMLRNQKVKIKKTNFLGIDDTEKSEKMITTLKKFSLSKKEFNILLFHRPKKFVDASMLGVDLMLTGHTHGGQIFPLNILMKIYYRKIKGLTKKHNSYLYVSPGTGWWGPPMRLGSRNEITVFELKPSD